jgi:hypothetical protein
MGNTFRLLWQVGDADAVESELGHGRSSAFSLNAEGFNVLAGSLLDTEGALLLVDSTVGSRKPRLLGYQRL